jgi:hypothetical protein
MTIHLFRFFFFIILLSMIPGFAVATCTIPGTNRNCNELVADLPWPFIIHVKEQEPIRITYMSTKDSQQRNPNLKMFLEIDEHEKREDAAEAFSKIQQKAHPDMGLSYAWDLVTIRDRRIYHLHADCTLAEHYFTSMVETLKATIGPSNRHPSQTLLCRCGGGCKLLEE